MPEIAEVARAVHYVKKHLVGRTLQKVTAIDDANVFGKVGTSHTEIMKHLTGKKVVDAGQQGKYFWMIMSSPPHPVMHFGMSGWLKFKSEHTYYYRKKDDKDEEWPPKYWKVQFETDGEGEDKVEAAYVDLRRLGRVRLVDCPGDQIRQHSPLVENGPDPVQDKDKVTVKWLKNLCQRKKVPIKAMLLDQANISGIGNWVGDEIMFHARMHPEQYANTLSDEQIEQLHKSILYICSTAVDLLGDSDQFPEDWLFKHRWNKGKKETTNKLPNGEKIVFLTVGGRTSAVVPSLQRKTGPVAKEMSEAEEEEKPKKGRGKKKEALPTNRGRTANKPASKKRVKEAEESDEEEKPATKRTTAGGGRKKVESSEPAEEEPQKNGEAMASPQVSSGRKTKSSDENVTANSEAKAKAKPASSTAGKAKNNTASTVDTKQEASAGRRRSGRLRK